MYMYMYMYCMYRLYMYMYVMYFLMCSASVLGRAVASKIAIVNDCTTVCVHTVCNSCMDVRVCSNSWSMHLCVCVHIACTFKLASE